ncbi:aldo/keto reductase [Bauldia litoralis]|uniref:aldo/keto reductase n=1 Tax=Bauldia litoralis TaxID=665467 RepID=UPI003263D918
MLYRKLGNTDIEISAVSFGTGSLGELFGPLDEGDALRLVDEAIDSGINFIDTSPFYGSAEYRLGKALPGKRDKVILGTKAGRYGVTDFDYSAKRVRESVETSLRLMNTDYLDILQLHDIEHVPLERVLNEGYAALVQLRDEGKCRYIGMTGYPLATMRRVMTDVDLDVLLTYAHGTLLDNSIGDLQPLAQERGVGLINAAALTLGLLSPGGSNVSFFEHPASTAIQQSAAKMIALGKQRGVDLAFIANQYAIQESGCATTVVGVGKSRHLASAVDAVSTPIDAGLLAELLALRPAEDARQWISGLPENN